MSKLGNKKVDENGSSVNKPNNGGVKPFKRVPYRELIRAELADELYNEIKEKLVVHKKYKQPNYLAKDLARELETNTRYLSAVINARFGKNFSCLVNECRVEDARLLLVDKRYADKSIEQISALVGFANRQSFYTAFFKIMGEAPNNYRKRHEAK